MKAGKGIRTTATGLTIAMAAVYLNAISPGVLRAHHPDAENHPVRQHIEPIPPWLNNLPSYRERYNRPRYIGGKIAYWIAPSSQEAMSWHRSVHRGYYANHAPRMEDRYFYPKPWQALTVGPRVPNGQTESTADSSSTTSDVPVPPPNVEPIEISPVVEPILERAP